MEIYSFSNSTVRYAAYTQSAARQKPPVAPGERPGRRGEDVVEISAAGRAAALSAKGASVSVRDDYLFTASATGFNDSPLVQDLRLRINGWAGGIVAFETQHERTYSAAGYEVNIEAAEAHREVKIPLADLPRAKNDAAPVDGHLGQISMGRLIRTDTAIRVTEPEVAVMKMKPRPYEDFVEMAARRRVDMAV